MKRLLEEQSSIYAPAGLLVFARIANVVVGLATIPVFIHFLGGEGFAAWALMLATSAAYTALEIGMAPTYVKHAAPMIQQADWHGASVVLASAMLILASLFAVASVPILLMAPLAAAKLHLPETPLFSPAGLMIAVFAAVALRSLLQFGGFTLSAARRFRALAVSSFLQSLASNLAAAITAILTGRLDLTLIAFWSAQLLVVLASFLFAQLLFRPVGMLALPRLAVVRSLMPHGLKVQVCDWAQIVTFQFDKFIIASLIGLWGVAPYEVANRSVMALRSIPASGLESFLPSASIGQSSPDETWQRYLALNRLAVIAVVIFMLAPLAIAPSFLYSWTGQMGYLSRGAFIGLMAGFVANVLALPAAAMVQAAGRADIQARSALLTMAVNIPLSLLLLFQWGMTGAAIGTSVAMIAGSAMLVAGMHRAYGKRLAPTLATFAEFWPAVVVCAAFFALTYVPFENWLASIPEPARWAWRTRLGPTAVSALAYIACVATMIAIQVRRGLLTQEQSAGLSRWLRMRRGAVS